jgi:hypothetical protein
MIEPELSENQLKSVLSSKNINFLLCPNAAKTFANSCKSGTSGKCLKYVAMPNTLN